MSVLPQVRDQRSTAEDKTLTQAQQQVLLATILGILFLGLALILHRLDASSLSLDQGKTVTTSRLGFIDMGNFQAEKSVHPPLLYLVTGFFIRLLEEEIPHHLLRSMAGEITLLGYDVSPATFQAGVSIRVTLWWQALSKMDRDYTAFAHLTGPEGRLCAQYDSLLVDGGQSTSAWPLGLLVRDDYQLHVPLDAPAGDYWLTTGVYYWETGERLPVWDEQGRTEAGDALVLPTITLSELLNPG
jgi:hypothetical protein